ncbi:nucleoside-diphosphate-sugar epimerase [Sphaerochaeta pleomorpha str. Grapes]|uniref:Nucleoside-diphosphate-sugar epimerase n=1 Tax=Sphaerochaeta pleomorpha (strain ATCC BAA-1885 / DSM 22778 / Grapes) TaxID=158190 RepID=G8QVX8_SPHPG|nr:NAD-dependent epimerase/dehydratase family protein [Sphaerochaeta pleomorpha]AEV30502.1 nucleoside-diphosphate-sugar epimerase [Sphaerochaeta pleomorpha str. Grapes]
MKHILIIGSLGQLGSEIAMECRRRYGSDNVVLTDIRDDTNLELVHGGPFYKVDCRDGKTIAEIVQKHHIDTIYHLAAILSATAEKNPLNAWNINIGGLVTTLEIARENGCAVFTPSSIGAFGPTTPKKFTPQDTIQRPTSIYGVSKVAGELLCDYYNHKYDVDTRGVRFPGVISNMTPPGGGTTDYAVEIYYEAVRKEHYTCFLRGDTYLDMIYMPDAIQAAIQIMEADPARLRHRNAFNIASMSFCPEEQAAYIRKLIPGFTISYEVDPVRQAIADSWPDSLEDYAARVEWDWKPKYDLFSMTKDMIDTIKRREL